MQAETAPTLKTLVTAVVAGNLSNTLSSRGPFTVFAPDDKAFAAIDPNVLASLLRPENIGELDALLELHVVSGDIRAKDIKDDQKIKTLAGAPLHKQISVNISVLQMLCFVLLVRCSSGNDWDLRVRCHRGGAHVQRQRRISAHNLCVLQRHHGSANHSRGQYCDERGRAHYQKGAGTAVA